MIIPVRQGVSTTQTLQYNFICEMRNQSVLVLRVTDDNTDSNQCSITLPTDWQLE